MVVVRGYLSADVPTENPRCLTDFFPESRPPSDPKPQTRCLETRFVGAEFSIAPFVWVRPNHDGLESAKPDLQSVFKKPGGDTAEP